MVDFTTLFLSPAKRVWSCLANRRHAARMHLHMNELPDHILRDIGWPEAYVERRVQHGTPDNGQNQCATAAQSHAGDLLTKAG